MAGRAVAPRDAYGEEQALPSVSSGRGEPDGDWPAPDERQFGRNET